MRFYAIIIATITMLSACTNTKKQEQDSLNEVIKIHDQAMAKSEQVMNNKMLLDSLSKTTNNLQQSKIKGVTNNLVTADKAMENWMHQFNADYTGKSHEEIMQYLADQKKKVDVIDKQLNTAVTESNQFISNIKK